MNELKRELLDILEDGVTWYREILDYGTDRDYNRGVIQGIQMAIKIVSEASFDTDDDTDE